jgi:hypothetical protein
MAYMDFTAEPALLSGTALAPVADPVPTGETGLSALEWSVVALARRDSLSSLRRPGRLSVALGGLFGTRHNPRLADPRLEALRRMAVHAWFRGYAVPKSEVQAFLAAGYTIDQYETMMASISVAKMGATSRRAA